MAPNTSVQQVHRLLVEEKHRVQYKNLEKALAAVGGCKCDLSCHL